MTPGDQHSHSPVVTGTGWDSDQNRLDCRGLTPNPLNLKSQQPVISTAIVYINTKVKHNFSFRIKYPFNGGCGWQNVNSGQWQEPDKWIRGLMISGGPVRNVLIVFLTPDS